MEAILVTDSFKEWRGFTPILLVVIMVLAGLTSWFALDKLNRITDSIHTEYELISGVKSSFDDYKQQAGERFAVLETKMADIQIRLKN